MKGKTTWIISDGFMSATEKGNYVSHEATREVPYAILVESDTPIVVQHSRMDVSQPEMTLMTTIAY